MLNRKKLLMFCVYLFFFLSFSCNESRSSVKNNDELDNTSFKLLTLNTWHEGTSVDSGFEAIVKVIEESEADIIALCEISNYNNSIFSERVVAALKLKGIIYNSFNSGKSSIILSKFPILSTGGLKTTSLTKCIIKLNNSVNVAIYGAHLDYTHYACYLPRGYDGITWKKLPEPVVDVDKILQQNIDSARDEAITVFLNDAEIEKNKSNIVFIAGDFNEPSHLDWIDATKKIYDHNGVIVPWQNSIKLKENGYLDTYRVKYPNPVTHPGFTWAAYNTDVELSKLIWTPDADDRDRIDFIYYHKDDRLVCQEVKVMGPSGSIVKGKGIEDKTRSDMFLLPKGKWPSDHKGVLAIFKLKQ